MARKSKFAEFWEGGSETEPREESLREKIGRRAFVAPAAEKGDCELALEVELRLAQEAVDAAVLKRQAVKDDLKAEERKRRAADQERQNELDAQFRAEALKDVGLANHPKKDAIFARAWEEGHSGGYADVLCELEELAQFLHEIEKKD